MMRKLSNLQLRILMAIFDGRTYEATSWPLWQVPPGFFDLVRFSIALTSLELRGFVLREETEDATWITITPAGKIAYFSEICRRSAQQVEARPSPSRS